eukprot:7723652-Lingulodinium_polyedra.AAC.1
MSRVHANTRWTCAPSFRTPNTLPQNEQRPRPSASPSCLCPWSGHPPPWAKPLQTLLPQQLGTKRLPNTSRPPDGRASKW